MRIHSALAAPLLTMVAGALTLGVVPAWAASQSATISNFAYHPDPITVAVGTSVTWTNDDQAPHSVTADGGAFDSSPTCSPSATTGCIQPNRTFTFTFSQPGTFAYHCRVHSFMHGTVTVTAAAPTTTAPTTPPPTAAQAPAATTTTTARTAPPTTETQAPAAFPTTAASTRVTAAPHPSARAVAPTSSLPNTGGHPTPLAALGAGSLLLGGTLTVLSRRRRPRRP